MTSEESTVKEFLRHTLKQRKYENWGFRIYRCTYESQERWDKFMSLIKADALEFLEGDADLWDSLAWDVVENKESLGEDGDGEGKDWKEVRAFHDNWVLEKLKLENEEKGREEEPSGYEDDEDEYEGKVRTEREVIASQVERFLHYQFFIFADEASMNSVVDGDARNARGAAGSYYITLVQSGLVPRWNENWEEEADEDEPEFDEEDPEQRLGSLQSFKAWDLVVLYNAVLKGLWPDEFSIYGMGNGITAID